MNKRILLSATAMLGALLLPGCSEPPKPAANVDTQKTEPAKAPEAISARSAFFEVYKTARSWATDLLALSVASGEIPNIENKDGKAGLWTVVFVSPSLRQARTFTWAVADSGADIRKGANVGNALDWAGATPASMPFAATEFTVDSDAAYKTGLEKAEAWVKAHPGEKVSFRLGNASKYAAPVWYIMWGSQKNGFAALVNATTGVVVK